jgi:hypothetical protein
MSQLSKKEDIIVILDAEKKELALTLAKQRQAYSFLEDKYHKLIRPARSPLGKKVVAVHYARGDGDYRILFKDLNTTEFKSSPAVAQTAHSIKKQMAGQAVCKNNYPRSERSDL